MTKNLAESLNNILDIIENKCADAEGKIQFNPEHLNAFAEETAYIKERMGLEPFQAILFAVIIVCNASGRCNVNNVGKRLGMGYLQMLSYSKDLYALRDRGLIRMKGNNDLSVPGEVVECIMSGEFASFNRLTGNYYYKKINYSKDIHEIWTVRNDWQQDVFADFLRRGINRTLEDKGKK